MGNFIMNVDFGQSDPPSPENQGDMGPRFVQDPMTSEAPTTGFVETDDDPGDLRFRGYREPGLGGSATPGTPHPDGNTSERSQASGGSY
jgi:hypothetical protein